MKYSKSKHAIEILEIIDIDYLSTQTGEHFKNEETALNYYIEHGVENGLNPTRLFSTNYYLERNPDVKESGVNPFIHYMSHGHLEMRSFHPCVHVRFLAKEIEKFGFAASENILHTFLKRGSEFNISTHPLFDSGFYRTVNSLNLSENPVIHYLKGHCEAGISIYFDEEYYCGQYGLKLGEGLCHFVEHGSSASTSALIDRVTCHEYRILDSSRESFFSVKFGKFFDPSLSNENGVLGLDRFEQYFSSDAGLNLVPARNIVPQALERHFGNPSVDRRLAIESMLKARTQYINLFSNCSPKISIIILNWNKSLMTLQCVYTLLKNTFEKNIEIIVVDNGSHVDSYSDLLELRAYSFVKIVRNKSNRYFGEANNIGFEHSRGKYVCLLNNDAFVDYHWDQPLVKALSENDKIGAAGPKFIFPDGRLQEAGADLSPCGQNVQIGKGLDADLPCFNIAADVKHISAACLLIRRAVFERVNGFDYRYEPAYYEDADLSAKIGALDYSIRYCPDSVVMHVENATSKDPDIGFSFNSLISTNRLKFVEKWGMYFRGGKVADIPDFSPQYSQEIEFPFDDVRVAVVYSPYPLMPGGGERYVLSLAIAAKNKGYRTYFCTPEAYTKFRLNTVAYELGLDVSGIGLLGLDDLVDQKIDLFICMGNELTPSLKALGSRQNIYHCQFPFPMSGWHLSSALDTLENYDCVIVNSAFTRNCYIQEADSFHIRSPQIHVVSPPVEDIGEQENSSDDDNVNILSVGRFISGGHNKKQFELVEAFNSLSDTLRAEGIESKLSLVGSLGASEEDRNYLEKVRSIAGNRVEIILNASRSDLVDKYREADFYWHGTGLGEDIGDKPHVFEHFGITPIEAMSAGVIPIVYKYGGPAENIRNIMPENASQRLIASDVLDYAKKTHDILSGDRSFYRETMLECAASFSEGSFNTTLDDLLDAPYNNFLSDKERIDFYLGRTFESDRVLLKQPPSDSYSFKIDQLYVGSLEEIEKIGVGGSYVKDFSLVVKAVSHSQDYDRFPILFGDRSPSVNYPLLVKSRGAEEQFGAILKLNAKRHWVDTQCEDELLWYDKKPAPVWRGVTTGYSANENNPRYILVSRYSEKYDVGVSKIVQGKDDWSTWLRKPLTIEEQLRFKYLICLEGNDVCTGLKWALRSNSLPIMPKPTKESWLMETKLIPYVHYVPLNDSLSDLDEIIEWCIENDSHCHWISANGKSYMRQFDDADRELRLQQELLQNFMQSLG